MLRNNRRIKISSPQWLGTTWALALRDLMASNLASSPASKASNSLSFLNSSTVATTASPPNPPGSLACSAGFEPAADAGTAPPAESKARLLGPWRFLVNRLLWIGGWAKEDFSRVTRFDGVDEEPDEPRLLAFRLWAPARRREAVGSEAGDDSPRTGVRVPASRRFSSMEGFCEREAARRESVIVCVTVSGVGRCTEFCVVC